MTRVVCAALAFVAISGAGLLHGYMTDRWAVPADLQGAAKKIHNVPLVIGGWRGDKIEMDEKLRLTAGAQEWWTRRYVDRGREFVVYLACGRPGPMAVHTPTVCYRGAGWQPIKDPARRPPIDVASGPVQFWVGDFKATSGGTTHFKRVYWTWNAKQAWLAPDYPRLEFPRSYGFTYKLHIDHKTNSADEGHEAAEEFIRLIAPEIERALYAKSG